MKSILPFQKITIVILLWAVFLIGCGETEGPTNHDGGSEDKSTPKPEFLPLVVGNWWEYTVTGKKDETSRRLEVTNTTDISGKTLYVLTVTGKDPSGNSLPAWTITCLNENGTLMKLLDSVFYTVIPEGAEAGKSYADTTLTFTKMPAPVNCTPCRMVFDGKDQDAIQISQHHEVSRFTYDCQETYIKGVGLVESGYGSFGCIPFGDDQICVGADHHYKLNNYYVKK
jgi:hypothetical protein